MNGDEIVWEEAAVRNQWSDVPSCFDVRKQFGSVIAFIVSLFLFAASTPSNAFDKVESEVKGPNQDRAQLW